MLVLGIVLFAISLGALALYIACMCNMDILNFIGTIPAQIAVVYVCLACFLLFGYIAHRIFRHQRYKHGKRGVNSVFYYITIVQYYLFHYTVDMIISLLVGFIRMWKILLTGKSASKPKKTDMSTAKSEIKSYVSSNVHKVAPSSEARYEFDLRESYSHFCIDRGYDENNKKLATEFEKQYYNQVYAD